MPAESKFTEGVRAAVLGALRDGLSVEDACLGLGVSPKTVKNWLARGRREGTGPFADFAAEVEGARAHNADRVADAGLSQRDLVRLLEVAARRGSVTAAKFLGAPALDVGDSGLGLGRVWRS